MRCFTISKSKNSHNLFYCILGTIFCYAVQICKYTERRMLEKSFDDNKTKIKMAICKPRHWNLGIGTGIGNGIGIGTDIPSAIISSTIRSMDPKLSRMVT